MSTMVLSCRCLLRCFPVLTFSQIVFSRFISKERLDNGRILVKVVGEEGLRHYNPHSDACLWRNQIPFWLLEVSSAGADDCSQLLLEGASLVKNFSHCSHSFVLPLICIDCCFKAKVIFMFSSEKKDKVCSLA